MEISRYQHPIFYRLGGDFLLGVLGLAIVGCGHVEGDLSPSESFCAVQTDNSADGSVDSQSSFSSNGNQSVMETDEKADGIVDERSTTFYDERGNVSKVESDIDADGSVDSQLIYTYDSNGNPLTKRENDELTTMRYDQDGRLVESEVDSESDGILDLRQTCTYPLGRNETECLDDIDANGEIEIRTVSVEDNSGNPLSIRTENFVLGSTSLVTYTYDAAGRQIRQDFDYEADGIIDLSLQNTFTADGSPLQEEVENDDVSGIKDRLFYRYGADGRQESLEIDEGADGTIDLRQFYVYDCL